MALTTIDIIHEQLRDAILDASGWATALSTINEFVGSSGLVLLSVDERLKHSPCTQSISEMMEDYFTKGWHARDARELCLPLLVKNKVVVDDDFQDAELIEKSNYHRDFLSKHKQKWFAGVGAFVDDDLWCLAFQRSQNCGRFQESDRERLQAVQAAFARSVGLASKTRKGWIAGALTALQGSGEAAFFVDRSISFLDGNVKAQSLLRPFVNRKGQLELPDKRAAAELFDFVQECRDWRSATNIKARLISAHFSGQDFLLEVIPLMREEALFFHRIAAFVKISARPFTIHDELRTKHRLSNADVRVADALSQGTSIQEMADLFGVSLSTVRFQLKNIYAKTQTGTQAKLLALMLRIQSADSQQRYDP